MIDLAGRTAIVTGGNQGIGWAIAEVLARHRARLVVNYSDDTRYPDRLGELGENAVAVRGNVVRLEEIDAPWPAPRF